MRLSLVISLIRDTVLRATPWEKHALAPEDGLSAMSTIKDVPTVGVTGHISSSGTPAQHCQGTAKVGFLVATQVRAPRQ